MAYDFLFLDEAQVLKNTQTKDCSRRMVCGASSFLCQVPHRKHLGSCGLSFKLIPGALASKRRVYEYRLTGGTVYQALRHEA